MARFVLITGLAIVALTVSAFLFPTCAYIAVKGTVSFIVDTMPQYQPGIDYGENNYHKELFYKHGNGIQSIQVGHFTSDNRHEIAVCGCEECDIIDVATKKSLKKIKLIIRNGETFDSPYIIKVNGKYRIIFRRGWYSDVAIIDDNQQYIWKSNTSHDNNHLEYCGDGLKESYCFFHEKNISVLNGQGEIEKSWEVVPSRIRSVGILNYDPLSPIIVTSLEAEWLKEKGNVTTWDIKGRKLQEFIPDEPLHINIVKWPTNYNILTNDDTHIYLMDFNGKVLFKYRKPYFRLPLLSLSHTYGVSVISKNKSLFNLCIIAKIYQASRSMLLIFNGDGTNIYQEVYASPLSIATLPNPDGTESLLVAELGGNNIWIYN